MIKENKITDERKKVMIVDNDIDVTRMVENALVKTGNYNVISVNEPATAIGVARKYQPDLMLLDVVMPGVQGPEIAAQLSHDNDLKDIPIIFLSGLLDRKDTGETGKQIGRYMCLAKPFKAEDLIACIEKFRKLN